MTELRFSEDPEISDLIRKVAAGEAKRGRAMGWWRSDWYFDWQDVAQEIACEVPAWMAAFNPDLGVPLMAYLWQRLTWKARKIIAPERDWQGRRVQFEENEAVESGEGHGTRTVGSQKITLRDFGAGSTLESRSISQLRAALDQLPPCDRAILMTSATQSQIANRVSEFGTPLSQSQVSRRIQAATKKLSAIMHKPHPPEIYT